MYLDVPSAKHLLIAVPVSPLIKTQLVVKCSYSSVMATLNLPSRDSEKKGLYRIQVADQFCILGFKTSKDPKP